MAQKGFPRSSMDPFTAATEACRRRKMAENKGRGRGRAVACFSPWSVISCWFHLGRSKCGMNFDFDELAAGEVTEDRTAFGCLELDPESSNSSLHVSGGDHHSKEASLSLGVGFGLIYLMAANKNEITKLSSLCQQMETVLENFKREFPNDQQSNNYSAANINNNTSFSTPKAQVFSSLSVQEECPSYSWEKENSESSHFTASSSYQNSATSKLKRKGKRLEMDLLEAELEAELKCLQLRLDDDDVTFNYSDQRRPESEIMEVEEGGLEESISTSMKEAAMEEEEVEEMEDMSNIKQQQGVNPRELERRLHELQQVMRQRERIRELESALQNALNNIDESQKELSWWKDTAKIVFHHNSV